jgi:hypothetical protein
VGVNGELLCGARGDCSGCCVVALLDLGVEGRVLPTYVLAENGFDWDGLVWAKLFLPKLSADLIMVGHDLGALDILLFVWR